MRNSARSFRACASAGFSAKLRFIHVATRTARQAQPSVSAWHQVTDMTQASLQLLGLHLQRCVSAARACGCCAQAASRRGPGPTPGCARQSRPAPSTRAARRRCKAPAAHSSGPGSTWCRGQASLCLSRSILAQQSTDAEGLRAHQTFFTVHSRMKSTYCRSCMVSIGRLAGGSGVAGSLALAPLAIAALPAGCSLGAFFLTRRFFLTCGAGTGAWPVAIMLQFAPLAQTGTVEDAKLIQSSLTAFVDQLSVGLLLSAQSLLS